jgi:predicted ATPase
VFPASIRAPNKTDMERTDIISGPRMGNLPVPLSSFVGRRHELSQLEALVTEHRLVTVFGPGGAGKTRLAIETLRRLDAQDIDGPWLVELAGVEDGDLVTPAVAQTLGLTVEGVGSAAIVDALAGRPAVLLLDNCEQIVGAVAELAESLATSESRIHVVTTSREPLRVPGEVLLQVESLDADDAWRLFNDRAAHALRGFQLGPDEAAVVEDIVRDLDGLPLAIELAAARVGVLSVAQLAEILSDRFDVLTEHGRTTAPRHRTLAAAIEWSYRLLEPAEQDLFEALSVFRDGFEMDAVTGVCNLDTIPAATRLGSLAAKSMLAVRVLPDGSRRYRMLESLRQYGAARLAPDRAGHLRSRHARWFADLADTAEQHLRSANAVTWMTRLRRDQDNLRAATEFALESGDLETAVRIVGAQSWYWYRLGMVEEGRLWHRRVRDVGDPVDPWLRARAGIGAAALAYLAGDMEHGMVDLRVGNAAAEAAGDPTWQAIGQLYSGYLEIMQGDAVAGSEHFARARELARPGLAEDWVVAEVGMLVGTLQRLQGDPEGGLATTLEARTLAERIGHRWAAGSSGWLASKILVQLGELPRAATLMASVLRQLTHDEDVTSLLTGLHTLAAIAARDGLATRAVRLLGGVDAVGDRIGYHPEVMDPVDSPAYRESVLAALGDPARAAELERGAAMEVGELVELALELADEVADAARARTG